MRKGRRPPRGSRPVTSMLPRRFALIRHVDYTGVAGTGVIAYGVAFDDGQVVLRWSSAHRATSVLDSVEDLIAAHGHGEATSIEWIDAPPGQADEAPAQPSGRRAKRPATEAPGEDTKPPRQLDASLAEPSDVRPAMPVPPAGHAQPSVWGDDAQVRQHAAAAAAPVTPAAQASPAVPATTGAAATTSGPEPGEPVVPSVPPTASPATSQAPADVPVAAESAVPAASPADRVSPVPNRPAAGHESPQPPAAAEAPRALPTLPAQQIQSAAHSAHADEPAGVAPYLPTRRLPAPATEPSSNGTSPHRTSVAPAAAASDGTDSASRRVTELAERASRRRVHDREAEIIDHPAADSRDADDERLRSRHEVIATQPMNDLSQRSRRAERTPDSPRSIFDETEDDQSRRPDLRLASSNGRRNSRADQDETDANQNGRETFRGFFSTGHQHVETVTGLLDLPAGLAKRGRGNRNSEADDEVTSRRNGRHRGE